MDSGFGDSGDMQDMPVDGAPDDGVIVGVVGDEGGEVGGEDADPFGAADESDPFGASPAQDASPFGDDDGEEPGTESDIQLMAKNDDEDAFAAAGGGGFDNTGGDAFAPLGDEGEEDGNAGDGMAMPEEQDEPQYNALREFNSAWRLQLDQKKQLFREKEEVLREDAKEEIMKMYEESKTNRETRQAANRQSEQKFWEDMEAQTEVENPWQRVTSLIETNANAAVNKQDVARMRSILVHLKKADFGPAIPVDE